MAIKYSVSARTGMANALVTDAGTNPQIKIYTGSPPSTVATAPTGTLLATLTITGSLGTVASGAITLATVTGDSSADATATAGCFRIMKSDGTTGVMDGTVTNTGGGGDMTFDSTSFVSGGAINITSGLITMGGA